VRTRIATFRRPDRTFGCRLREVPSRVVVAVCCHGHRTRDAALTCAQNIRAMLARKHPDARVLTAEERTNMKKMFGSTT
jgi:hypothetical protein